MSSPRSPNCHSREPPMSFPRSPQCHSPEALSVIPAKSKMSFPRRRESHYPCPYPRHCEKSRPQLSLHHHSPLRDFEATLSIQSPPHSSESWNPPSLIAPQTSRSARFLWSLGFRPPPSRGQAPLNPTVRETVRRCKGPYLFKLRFIVIARNRGYYLRSTTNSPSAISKQPHKSLSSSRPVDLKPRG